MILLLLNNSILFVVIPLVASPTIHEVNISMVAGNEGFVVAVLQCATQLFLPVS